MKEQWILTNKKANFSEIAATLNVTPLLVKLMLNRGVAVEDMEHYIRDDITSLGDPLMMKDLKEAADILMRAAGNGERIAIVNDYDCDGIFSGMILYTGLKKLGAEPDIYTPDRVKDGYGINKRIIDEIYNQGINYIITCDNGIAAYDEIAYAKELGITVIVTDHHEIPFDMDGDEVVYKLPPADAVCDPKRQDCDYPFKGLCGAGVVYRIIDYLYGRNNIGQDERNVLVQYAAIATVADIMELKGENRTIVKTGLKYLSDESTCGLTAIKQVCGLGDRYISAYHIGFVIGPCFNAAGRIQTVKPAINLLQTDNEEMAAEYAEELFNINAERKKMTEEGAENAMQIIAEDEELVNDRVIVIILDDCHESLAGIIAGRIKEALYKPVLVFTRVGEGLCKGSGRSIPAYNMFEELSACKELYERFGGHAMAAGITMKEEYVAELKTRLNSNCKLTVKDMTPILMLDTELLFRHVTKDMINSLHILEPFGNGNPKPVFAAGDVKINRASVVGRVRKILKLNLTDKIGDKIEAVYFGDPEQFLGDIESKYGSEQRALVQRGADNNVKIAIAFYPDINEYNGMETLQLVIQNYMM